MRAISKKREPPSLSHYRAQGDATYRDCPTPVRRAIRDGLLDEQGHLCAYCMQRISSDSAKIEHWHSQAGHPNEQLHYKNMLGCCDGSEGTPPGHQHCDTRKRDREISYNPARPTHHERLRIRYSGDGTLRSDDVAFDNEINDVLNLNHSRLRRNRREVVKAVCEGLSRDSSTRAKGQIQRLLAGWKTRSADGQLPEYCDVAVYYLQKRLARA